MKEMRSSLRDANFRVYMTTTRVMMSAESESDQQERFGKLVTFLEFFLFESQSCMCITVRQISPRANWSCGCRADTTVVRLEKDTRQREWLQPLSFPVE